MDESLFQELRESVSDMLRIVVEHYLVAQLTPEQHQTIIDDIKKILEPQK